MLAATPAFRARITASSFVVLWSSAFIAGAIGLGAAPPLLLTATRLTVAGLILALIAAVTRAPWPRGRELGHVIVAGLLIQAVQFGAFYLAMSLGLPAALTALVQGLSPVLTALLAWPMLGERSVPRQWLGFGLGAAGVVLAVASRGGLHGPRTAAVVLAALGLAGGSLGTVYQKRYCALLDLRTGTATQLLVSVPVLAAATLIAEHPHVSKVLPFAAAVGWLAVVNSIGAFTLLYVMLRRSAASQVSSLFFLTPAVTAVLAYLVLGQRLGWLTIAGLAVSGAGVMLATRTAGASGSADAGPDEGADRVGDAGSEDPEHQLP
jgi:drug/metabolite transporter (DMT)-like permease